jgi:hypothetical protein
MRTTFVMGAASRQAWAAGDPFLAAMMADLAAVATAAGGEADHLAMALTAGRAGRLFEADTRS